MEKKLNEAVERVAFGRHKLDCEDACFLDGTTHRQAAIRNCKLALKNIEWLVRCVECHVERSVDRDLILMMLVRQLLDAGLGLTVVESDTAEAA